mmetsp:Transcript_5188/g.15251  ORF Transcript_5188/g.15251 Transcript_5188/m.15251 type:complete len:258 (+) Transcript_5188:399-1172(+)
MSAVLNNGALVHDCNLVRIYDSRESVCNENDCALHLLDEGVQSLLDERLVLCIQGRGRLIEKEQPRAPQEAAGNGQPLALAPGEQHAALAHAGLVPLLSLQDELVRVGRAARRVQLLLRVRAPQPVGEVLLDGLGKELCVLRDEPAEGTDAARREAAHVLAIEKNAASCGLVEPHQQVNQRALAAAALADQCGHGARCHIEVDALEHEVFGPRLVAELDAPELEVPGHRCGLDGLALVRVHLRPCVDQRDYALRGRG